MSDTTETKKYVLGLTIIVVVVFLIVIAFVQQLFEGNVSSQYLQNIDVNTGIVSADSSGAFDDPFITRVPDGIAGYSPAPLPEDPSQGPNDAEVTIVEFGDFQCATCKDQHEVMKRVLEEYRGSVRYVWKDFPLPRLHEYAETAAVAARCADEQDAFWSYHNELFEEQNTFILGPWSTIAESLGLDVSRFDDCMEQQSVKRFVTQGYFIAIALELEEAPTLFVNERRLDGFQSFEQLKDAIDEELE